MHRMLSLPRRKGSIQHTFQGVTAIVGNILCVQDAGGAQTLYRAALSVSSVNFALKTAKEQEAILAGYAHILNSLSYPLQILIQVRPLNLDPYLARLHRPASRWPEGSKTGEMWECLTSDYQRFVRELAERRVVLERRFTIILPADDAPPPADFGAFAGIFHAFRTLRRAHTSDPRELEAFAQAGQHLNLRTETVARELERIGLVATRLNAVELFALCHRAWSPACYPYRPLAPNLIDGALHLTHAAAPKEL